MARRIRYGWNSIYDQFSITDDNGGASLPDVSSSLRDACDTWEQYLLDHFTPRDHFTGGDWAEGTRHWFVAESRRIEQEFRRQVPASQAVVDVSPFPGIVQLRLFVDYNDWPLWDPGGGTDEAEFTMLSDSLKADLTTWAGAWTPGHPDDATGWRLVARLRKELGANFEVAFYP